jgi:hypothetical protein
MMGLGQDLVDRQHALLRRRDVTGWFDMSEGTVVAQIVHATHRGP